MGAEVLGRCRQLLPGSVVEAKPPGFGRAPQPWFGKCYDKWVPNGFLRREVSQRKRRSVVNMVMDRPLATTEPSVDIEEAGLVERAKAGSPDAWTEIYEAHYHAIYRYIKARVFDETTAEDLASSVFVAALKSIRSYRYRGRPLLAWLYRIARNVVADYQRETLARQEGQGLAGRLIGRFRGERRAEEPPLPETNVAAPEAESDPAAMIEGLDVRDAIVRLPANQREVVILRFFVGLSAQEVATMTGSSPAAVYSLQARAIVSLRERLKQE